MSNRKGFTLIELMLVIIILGTLATVVFPRFVGRAKKAKIVAAKADINNSLAAALDMYEMDNGFFPSSDQGLDALRREPTASPKPKEWDGPYIKKTPQDPWGNPYAYISPGTRNKDYDLYSYGPDGADGSDDDITNWEEDE